MRGCYSIASPEWCQAHLRPMQMCREEDLESGAICEKHGSRYMVCGMCEYQQSKGKEKKHGEVDAPGRGEGDPGDKTV